MAENLIASLQIGRAPTMPIEEYRARKVALVTGKWFISNGGDHLCKEKGVWLLIT
jgi:hypothetical protein